MTDADPLAELLGSSRAFEEVKNRVRQMLARARTGGRLPPVLIQGETGTGKGLLARALHHASPRAAGPFIPVNCGAIPETLGESEFFGFARGAHSEARHAKVGLFQAADRGTIFLDEVGLLSAGHQARLLKVVEDRQVVQVGSTRPSPVDLWLISATNADLWADVADHKFRRDLYERLAVVTFTLPPLRERADDIVPLAERFLASTCAEYGLRPKRLAPDAQRRLLEHSWHGNVRELANVIERASLLVEADTIPGARLELASPVSVSLASSVSRPLSSRDVRRTRMLEALEQRGGNITNTAADLGVSRNTLRDWMRQEGVYPYPGTQDLAAAPPASERDAQGRTGSVEPVEGSAGLGSDASLEGITPPLSDVPQRALGSSADIHWERRWITLLRVSFAVESHDDARDSISALEIVADKVQTFGARVIELGRTALEAAFGLDPLEDAAQRAAYAALSIQRAGARARERSSSTLVSRIAVHADSYLVSRMGASIQIDQEAKQAASALLATLIAAAPPDSTVVSRTVLPFLRRRFDFDRPLDAGAAGEAHPLLGRADRPAMFDRQISAFVGRESEIGLLENRWSLAAQGLGQIVGIVGDPGVGKSRLIWEFLRGATSRGLVLEATSVALGRPTPYLAIIAMLRTCFGVEAGESDAAIRTKVAQHLADLDPSLAVSLPAFLSLLDVPTEDSVWEGLDPARRRRQTFDALKRLMFRESARQPLVLVFEDAHWADSETKALLETIADSLPVARVLMLVTFRPEYEHEWGNRTFYTQIRVDPLRGEGAQRFLHDLAGDHPSLDSLRARLIEWTGGNPFFLEETLWTLLETGVLQGERGAYRMVRPVTSIAVPETVHEVLAARMLRLAPPAYEVLQLAAVLGRRVPYDVLAALSTSSAEALDESLKLLQAREFLTETDLVDEHEFSFRHALTQEVAYASLPEDQRRALHARILQAMETVYASRLDDKVGDFAHHAFEGERWQEAVGYLHRAGTRALARSANTEAATCFEQALVAVRHLSDSRVNRELAIDLCFGLRNALTPLGQAQRTLEHLREAERLAGLLGDEHRRGRALSFAANCLCIMADYEGAIEASEQARQHAKSLGDFPLSVASGMYLGRAFAGLGEYRRAADVLREVAESLTGERTYDYLGLPVLPAVFARSHLILALAELGEFDEAERFITEAIEIAERTRHPETLLWAHVAAGLARLVRGQLASATSALEHALELYRAADIPVYFPLVNSPLGLAYAMGGRIPEGLVLVEQAVERTESKRQVALLAWTLLRLGEVRLLADQPSAAGEVASRALTLFREHKERGGEAYTLRLLGEVEGRQGDAARAMLLVLQGYSLAQELGMKPLAARCQLVLGMLRTPGELHHDAATHLAASAQAFNNLGMEHWARLAEHAQTDRI